MSNRDSAYSITKGILGELGGDTSLQYDSTYSIVEAIYHQLGGNETDFESTYQIVLAILEGLENGTITPGTPVSGTLEITINGDYDVSRYASASVNVAGGGIIPSGSLTIVVNGDYDVTNYASASVNVPQGVFPSGTLPITENGEYEVGVYASASVNVPQGTFTSGNLSITENGNYDVNSYESASVSVPQGTFTSGNLEITDNGNYNVNDFVSASVNVPQGVFPSGTLNIIANGDYEVNQYESASVSVPGPSGSIAITANGNYDIAAYESASVSVAGGGGEIITDFSEAPLSFKCVQAGTLVGTNRLSGKTRYYSLDGGSTWTVLDENTTLNLSEGDVVSLGGNWGSGGMASDTHPNPLFEGTALVDVFGNIDSLIDKENFKTFQSTSYYSGNYTFKRLFEGNTQIRNCYNLVLPCPDTSLHNQKSTYGGMFKNSSITVAPQEIAATTLGYESCLEMFHGCANLTRGTKLRATKFLGNYTCAHMYHGCTLLTDVPNFEPIDQVSQGIFEDMFGNCTSMVIPPEVPLYTHASRMCDNMFSGCSNLKEAPGLPYTGALDNSEYINMFSNCTSLEFVPELPAEEISGDCYKSMFSGCTSLKRAPAILATRIRSANALQTMFSGCSNLTQVNIPYVTSSNATNGYSDWLNNVSGSGVINVNATYANQSQYPLNSTSGVPSGWTVVAEQPFTIPA